MSQGYTTRAAPSKVLGQSNPSAATLTTLYTVPGAGVMVDEASLIVCNRSGVATSFRVAVSPLGAAINDAHYIYYDVPILGNDTFQAQIGIALSFTSAADIVRCYATLATLAFSLFGKEYV